MDTASHLPQQHSGVKVLHSLERPGLTPVYGTTVPPSGLSGRLRSLAFLRRAATLLAVAGLGVWLLRRRRGRDRP